MEEGGDIARSGGEEPVSHEPPAPQPEHTTKEDSPGIHDSEPKVGLSEETPEESTPLVLPTPQTYLTFLVISGRRKTMSFEPETTVVRVKELVWNAWPSGIFHSLASKKIRSD